MSDEQRQPGHDAPEGTDRLGATFWVGLVVGGAVMAYGVKGLLGADQATQPPNFARFFIGAGIAHDALWAPVVVAVGWVTAILLPPVVRTPVRFALALSALAVVFAFPLVRGYGVREDNPSLFVFDYGRSLLVVLTVIWVATASYVAVRLVQQRRGRT